VQLRVRKKSIGDLINAQTYVATKETTPYACARVSFPNENQRRTPSAQAPSPQGSQAIDSLARALAALVVPTIAYRHRIGCGKRTQHEIAVGDSLYSVYRQTPNHVLFCVTTKRQMLKKQYRLKNSAQIAQVRRRGQSWHNRCFVLIKRANDRQESRFAFSVSRRLGKAVVRNRVKRVMRDCIRRRLSAIPGGWDVLLIARAPAQAASFAQVDGAIADLLARSCLQDEENEPLQSTQEAATRASDCAANRERAPHVFCAPQAFCALHGNYVTPTKNVPL
jgi:ribonuclease P protein component